MKKVSFLSAAKAVLTLFIFAGILTACSNSTSSDDHEHGDAEGFRLKMNGQTIVEQLPEQDLTGEFELEPGQETDLITIYFIDHDGEEFQPEEDSYSLGHEFEESGIAEFEQHAEDGKWSFHLHAEAEGITDLRLMLMHNGHDDLTSQGIHVHVEASGQ
ncbi:hypothetical protein [Gracilimonas sediminicola]|uniref:DUF4625 domain-containing protein n=1 Tax=Gracilimonas sediminicola TaxID=2952158 RepID=A0A9X2L0Y7_9BACT|nr:hypothetical protein [Gracilimonas sediminicola]MCP9290326.1 hypothetical protein [Gracilimonas sediminicola]